MWCRLPSVKSSKKGMVPTLGGLGCLPLAVATSRVRLGWWFGRPWLDCIWLEQSSLCVTVSHCVSVCAIVCFSAHRFTDSAGAVQDNEPAPLTAELHALQSAPCSHQASHNLSSRILPTTVVHKLFRPPCEALHCLVGFEVYRSSTSRNSSGHMRCFLSQASTSTATS